MATVREELSRAISALERAGVETPRVDAELLLADALGVRRLDLYAHPERALDARAASKWAAHLRRRLRREPLPYITGRVEFYGLPFRVGPAALIPRPETELLVEAVARRVPEDARVLDVGTGTGCIALSLAHRLPHAHLVGLEPSAAALELARQNAKALGFSERVVWIFGCFPEDLCRSEADCTRRGLRTPPPGPLPEAERGRSVITEPLSFGEAPLSASGRGWGRGPASLAKALDAIVSNPPYIPSAEVEGLAPELREFEPREALDGGADGLAVIRALVEVGPRFLRAGGLLAMEMAAGQSEQVRALAAERSVWRDVEVLPDLAGIPRVMVARCAG
jgi:release factor glutamine methyltransferase